MAPPFGLTFQSTVSSNITDRHSLSEHKRPRLLIGDLAVLDGHDGLGREGLPIPYCAKERALPGWYRGVISRTSLISKMSMSSTFKPAFCSLGRPPPNPAARVHAVPSQQRLLRC